VLGDKPSSEEKFPPQMVVTSQEAMLAQKLIEAYIWTCQTYHELV
jgi:hypothetical protein